MPPDRPERRASTPGACLVGLLQVGSERRDERVGGHLQQGGSGGASSSG